MFFLHLNGELNVDEYSEELINIYYQNKTIYIETPLNTQGNILIYNTMGQLLTKVVINDVITRIPIDKCANYVVRIISNNGVKAEKVVVR